MDFPRSQRLTVTNDTPRRAAKAACVNPSRRRASRTRVPSTATDQYITPILTSNTYSVRDITHIVRPINAKEMGAEAMVILGFDPGGVKQFGWCVAQATDNGRLHFRASGVTIHAVGAVRVALGEAEDFGRIGAAGIDSPLLWPGAWPASARASHIFIVRRCDVRGCDSGCETCTLGPRCRTSHSLDHRTHPRTSHRRAVVPIIVSCRLERRFTSARSRCANR